MPARFMVSCAARALGATRNPSRSSSTRVVGGDGLDLGDDQVRTLGLDHRAQARAVEHREDVAAVRDLHRRRVRVAVAGDDLAAEALQFDGHLLAELAGTEQHDPGGGRGERSAEAGGHVWDDPAAAGGTTTKGPVALRHVRRADVPCHVDDEASNPGRAPSPEAVVGPRTTHPRDDCSDPMKIPRIPTAPPLPCLDCAQTDPAWALRRHHPPAERRLCDAGHVQDPA